MSRNKSLAGCTRRELLQLLAAGLAAGVLGGCQRTATSEPWSAIINDPRAAARIGAAYLAAHPEEHSRSVLYRLLEPVLSGQTAEPIAALQQQVRADYMHNAVVSVTGWVLSVTEARLYALIAVSGGN
jgi:hypothetical protein